MPVGAAAMNDYFTPTSPSAPFCRVNQVFWRAPTILCNAALLRVIYQEGLFHSLNPKAEEAAALVATTTQSFLPQTLSQC